MTREKAIKTLTDLYHAYALFTDRWAKEKRDAIKTAIEALKELEQNKGEEQ